MEITLPMQGSDSPTLMQGGPVQIVFPTGETKTGTLKEVGAANMALKTGKVHQTLTIALDQTTTDTFQGNIRFRLTDPTSGNLIAEAVGNLYLDWEKMYDPLQDQAIFSIEGSSSDGQTIEKKWLSTPDGVQSLDT